MTRPLDHLPIERHRLANGLDIVLQPDSRLPLVTVNLWYHVGSKDESPGKTGFAHLFEHMLFQGSANVGTNDHFAHLQKVGGVANGSTWYDRTNYYETVPSHELDLALWLESDRMGFLLEAMTEDKLENQREVVMNERRQRVDNQPYGTAFERLFEELFPSPHPYHWPVIGTMEDIAAATLEDVRTFFATHYGPNNAVLTLTGDFSPEGAVASIERYFADIPPGPPPAAPRVPAGRPSAEIRSPVEDQVELPRVYLGYRIPAYGTREWLLADMLGTALCAGKSSPVYRDLVYDRQLAQDVSAGALPTELEGSFIVVSTARPGTSADQLLAGIDEHLERARSDSLGHEALERSRNRLVTAYNEQLQSLEARADLLAQATTFLGDPGRYLDRLEAYATITSDEIRAFAAAALDPERRVVVPVLPATGAGV